LTSNSSSKNNNNNQQQRKQQQQSAIELVNTKWELEEKCYSETLMPPSDQYNRETKRTQTVRKPFPRVKPVDQRGYELFYSKVINPENGKPYEERDSGGNIVKQPDGLGPIRHIVTTIVRVKNWDDNEYLYTLGTLYGFNSFGSLVSYYLHKPEVWTQTLFDKKRKYDQKSDRIIEITSDIMGIQDVYMIPFSAEAVDELYAKTIKTNTPIIYKFKNKKRTSSRPCNFIVRDERASGVSVAVEWSNIEKTLELFKTKSFEYLYNGDYIPAPVKAEMKANIESKTGEQVIPGPKINTNKTTTTTTTADNSSSSTATNNNKKDFPVYK
jgi:hypothetical protein